MMETASDASTMTAPPDTEIDETFFRQDARIIDVPAVENHLAAHERFHPVEIGAPELIPLREDDERVCTPESSIVIFEIADRTAEIFTRFIEGDGVVDVHHDTPLSEFADDRHARRVPHILRVRLEREAPDGHNLPRQLAAEMTAHVLYNSHPLEIIDRLDG